MVIVKRIKPVQNILILLILAINYSKLKIRSVLIIIFKFGPWAKKNQNTHAMYVFFSKEHKAEMYLDIVGFRLEYKEKNDSWNQAKMLFFNKSKTNCFFSA